MTSCEAASGKAASLRLGRKDGLFTLETRLFLPSDVAAIFAYRQQKLRELFA